MREITYAAAGIEAVAEEMRVDPKIFYMSTDTIAPLLKEFGPKRIKATPIAEGALTGISIGAAGSGYRPIMDWRQVTFSFVAMDQIVNQIAKCVLGLVEEPPPIEDIQKVEAFDMPSSKNVDLVVLDEPEELFE